MSNFCADSLRIIIVAQINFITSSNLGKASATACIRSEHARQTGNWPVKALKKYSDLLDSVDLWARISWPLNLILTSENVASLKKLL